LDVIRNTDQVKDSSVFQSPAPKRSLVSPLRDMFSKSGLTVGIDISSDCVRLVKTGSRFSRRLSILDFRAVPLNPGVSEDRNRMIDLLRPHLADFCTDSPGTDVWVSAPQEGTDVRRLRIPKVSGGKLENVVYWSYQKEAPFEKDRTILDFRILGDVIDKGVAKTEVLVCTTATAGVENLKAMFKAAGHELAGVMAPPFAIQNYFKTDWLDREETLSCSLLIDFNWSRIDIFRPGGDLLVSRGIKAGIASMIESIKSEAGRTTGGIPLPDTDDHNQVLDLPAFDAEEADQALELLGSEAGSTPSPVAGLLKDDDVFDMVLPALERLIRQVERTLEHVSLRFSDGAIGSMLMSGPITAYPRLVGHVASQLDMRLSTIDPFASVTDGLELPEKAADRAAYVSAVGLALSGGDHTPNFLLTRREASVKRRGTRLNQAVLVLFVIGILGLWGAHHLLQGQLKTLEDRIGRLFPVAAVSTGEDDRTRLLALAGRTNKSQKAQKAYAEKSLPVALIGEITGLAPEHIRFIRLEGGNRIGNTRGQDAEAKTGMTVDAVVLGSRGSVETRFAEYLLALKKSPIFSRVALEKKTFERLGGRDVLRFTLELEGV
jgi:Tfp pilus assembly PilM family ATPase